MAAEDLKIHAEGEAREVRGDSQGRVGDISLRKNAFLLALGKLREKSIADGQIGRAAGNTGEIWRSMPG